MITFSMILQLCIVLGALWVGSRYGSLALGAISGIGLAILVFGFGLKPGTPPTDVIYIIIAAVTCAGIMQASGGMDWLIQIAEKLLRKHPDHITFFAPLCTFFLTVLVGTGHVVYTLMPIICDIALKKGIRPERPCGVASIASQVGITCSPIAAAVVAFVTISNANHFDITIPRVLMISIPACLCGLMAAAAASYHRGLDLDKDPEFQKKIADPIQREYIYGSNATTLDRQIPQSAKNAVFIFLGALAVIVVFAALPDLLPSYPTVKAVKGAGDLTLASGVTITASALAKAGVVAEGFTEKGMVDLKMNLVIQIVPFILSANPCSQFTLSHQALLSQVRLYFTSSCCELQVVLSLFSEFSPDNAQIPSLWAIVWSSFPVRGFELSLRQQARFCQPPCGLLPGLRTMNRIRQTRLM